MWGDLWTCPFLASVWGTVASWVGVVGTLLSVGSAAFYYIRNQRLEEHAQARHVTFVDKGWTADKYDAVVYNFSDESIFDVTPSQRRVFRFREVLERVGQVSDERVEELRQEWSAASGGTWFVQSDESGHVRPGESKIVEFRGPKSEVQIYTISFRDSMARRWSLELNDDEPRREQLSDPESNYRIWHAFAHPFKYRNFRQKQRSFDRWLDEHAQDGRR